MLELMILGALIVYLSLTFITKAKNYLDDKDDK